MSNVGLGLLSVLLLAWAANCAVDVSVILHNFNVANNRVNSLNRFKRSDEQCASDCAKDIKKNIDTEAPELNNLTETMSKSPDSVTSISKPQFETFCKKIMKPGLACVSKCSQDSLLTTIFSKALAPAKFMCVDHYDDIYSNYDCLQSTQNDTKKQCEQDKCKDGKDAPTTLAKESKTLAQNGDFARIKKLMGDNCVYLNCLRGCQKPIIEKKCNVKIANLVENDLIAVTMKSGKEMLATINHTGDWPEQCDKVIEDAEGKKP